MRFVSVIQVHRCNRKCYLLCTCIYSIPNFNFALGFPSGNQICRSFLFVFPSYLLVIIIITTSIIAIVVFITIYNARLSCTVWGTENTVTQKKRKSGHYRFYSQFQIFVVSSLFGHRSRFRFSCCVGGKVNQQILHLDILT